MTHGKLGRVFWYGVVIAGSVLPLILISSILQTGGVSGALASGAALLALTGLFCLDEVWIKAGQAPPLS
jgi:formate-dependent nitrite reductase membrane component NrfD